MMDIEREEGEMSDDNDMLIDDRPVSDDNECTVLYKADKSGVVVQKLEKVDASKLEERAKRFGLNLSGTRVVTQKEIDELYSNCGIESGNERHFRFDALHLHGVEGLSTKEIFEYLEDYKPVSLEWIDDNSCNVVCQDHISTALALLVHSREKRDNDIMGISSNSSHHWREGMPHPKVDKILMRFATNGDKRIGKKRSQGERLDSRAGKKNEAVESKNPWGDLCKSWGVYDHQEIFQRKLPKNDYEEDSEATNEVVRIKNKRLAMRLGKRNYNTEDNEDSSSDSEWKKRSKTPRMRMHADDEESKKKKNINIEASLEVPDSETYAPLSIEVVNTKISYTPRDAQKLSDKFKKHSKSHGKNPSHGVRSRLGSKIKPSVERYSSSDESSSKNSEINEHTMSRVQKVDNLPKSSVWSRLEDKQNDQSNHRDLRNILKSKKKQSKSEDLRGRLGKLYKSNLRIEIDNDVLN